MTFPQTTRVVEPLPPPTALYDNRWCDLDVPRLGAWRPYRRVSVVLPTYDSDAALARTLAGFTAQTYPRDLLEIIVADDGSTTPVQMPDGYPLRARVVRQEHRGFGAARARNLGAAHADGEILVFLDSDMIPGARHVEAHARWHHVVADAVTIGSRRHVAVDGISASDVLAAARTGEVAQIFTGRRQDPPLHVEFYLARTRGLTTRHDDLFRLVGGNLGMRADTLERAGGFDEGFEHWGGEDVELGYRLYVDGCLLVPEEGALCWHQGSGGYADPVQLAGHAAVHPRFAQKIAHRAFRSSCDGAFEVPRLVTVVDAGDAPARQVLTTVRSALAGFEDCAVQVLAASSRRDALERGLADLPRVAVTPVGADPWPHAAYRLELPAGAMPSPDLVAAMVARLEDDGRRAVGLVRADAGGVEIRAVSTRAHNRAQRLTGAPAQRDAVIARYFGAARLTPPFQPRRTGRPGDRLRAPGPSMGRARRVFDTVAARVGPRTRRRLARLAGHMLRIAEDVTALRRPRRLQA